MTRGTTSNVPFLLMLGFFLVHSGKAFSISHIVQIDTIKVPLVTITDHFYPLGADYLSQNDSLWVATAKYPDAGIMLQNLTPIHLRTYGPGLIYSISIRGSNSAQASILWNGIPINSPMQGQSDLSLVHIQPGSRLSIHPNTYENGLSGTISLSDIPSVNTGLRVGFSEYVSSLKGHEATGQIDYSKKGLSARISANWSQSKNEFSFIKDGEKQIQEHNKTHLYQVKAQIHKNWENKHSLALHAWFVNANREIPPSLYEKQSDAIQQDQSLKTMGSYLYASKKLSVKATSAVVYDFLSYNSPLKLIHSNSQALRFTQQAQLIYSNSTSGEYHLQLENLTESVHSTAYDDKQMQHFLTLTGKYQKEWQTGHSLLAGIKTGSKDGNLSPLAPHAYYSFNPRPNLKLLFSAGRKYRYPSFNDYFWAQGGNVSLVPETAWESEAGIWFKWGNALQIETRAFVKKVENWIIWLPENGVFSAANLPLVNGKGLENSVKFDQKINPHFSFHARLFYNWIQIREHTDDRPELQMIYTPRHQIKNNVQLISQHWTVQMDQNWTGKVFTTSDHSLYLPGYYLMNIQVGNIFNIHDYKISIRLNIENLFNTQYFTINNFPMPGRVWRLGFSLGK